MVGKYAVVGAGAVVEAHASVKRSVLWPGARVGREAQARGCVLAGHALLDAQAQAFEGCALGTGAQALARAQLLPGVKVWPYKAVCEGERLESNRVWGAGAERGFRGDSLPLSDPAQATRAAQALAACLRPGEFLLARARSAVSLALFHACAAGLMSQGVQVVDAGVCTVPQLRYALRALGADGAALVGSDQLFPLTGAGAPLERGKRRALNALLLRQDFSGRLPASPGLCSAPGARSWAMWRRSPAPLTPTRKAPRRWRCSPRTCTCSIWRRKPCGEPGCAPAANGRKR